VILQLWANDEPRVKSQSVMQGRALLASTVVVRQLCAQIKEGKHEYFLGVRDILVVVCV
jgi:hypothetical protein